MRPLFKAPHEEWFLVPRGTGLQLNNPTSTKKENRKYDNSPLNKINRPRRLCGGVFVLARSHSSLACFALPSASRAVTPAPDGGYSNDNTAEGDNALFNLNVTTGLSNTAIGAYTLYTNISGLRNTAVGRVALYNNTGDYNTALGAQTPRCNTTGHDNTAVGVHAL